MLFVLVAGDEGGGVRQAQGRGEEGRRRRGGQAQVHRHDPGTPLCIYLLETTGGSDGRCMAWLGAQGVSPFASLCISPQSFPVVVHAMVWSF